MLFNVRSVVDPEISRALDVRLGVTRPTVTVLTEANAAAPSSIADMLHCVRDCVDVPVTGLYVRRAIVAVC